MAAPLHDFYHSRCRAPDGAVVLYSKVCYAKVLALVSSSALQQSASWGGQEHLAAVSQSQEKFVKITKTNNPPVAGVRGFCLFSKANKFLHPLHTEIYKHILDQSPVQL